MPLNQSILLMSLCCVASSISAQQKPSGIPLTVAPVAAMGIAPIIATDTLVYEVLETTPAILGLGSSSPVRQETRVDRKPNGHQIYTTATSKNEFDPVSMASTLKTKLDADLNLQIVSKKMGASWPVGSTWRVQHTSPPRIKSLCPRTVSLDYTAKVTGTSTHTMMLYGKLYAAEAVNVQMIGQWAAKGCGKGKLQMQLSYAPALQVLLAYDGQVQAGKMRYGATSSLKEIRR